MKERDRVVLKRYPLSGKGHVLRVRAHGVLVGFDDEKLPSRWVHHDAVMLAPEETSEQDGIR